MDVPVKMVQSAERAWNLVASCFPSLATRYWISLNKVELLTRVDLLIRFAIECARIEAAFQQ